MRGLVLDVLAANHPAATADRLKADADWIS
jgi:hypothetical protein